MQRGRELRRFGLILSLSVLNGRIWLVSRVPSAGGLRPDHGSICGAITSWTTLIHLAEDECRLEASFCLDVNRFLDQLIPAIKLSSTLVHPNFD